MLTTKTLDKIKAAGFSIQKLQDRFIAVMREAIEQLGGKNWTKSDLPTLFRNLEKEIAKPLCQDKDGPQLSSDSFKHYMSAAKKSLLFGIPFRASWRIAYGDIPQVKSWVESDHTDRPVEQKVGAAVKRLRENKRAMVKAKEIAFTKLPMPGTDGEWGGQFLAIVRDTLNLPEAERHLTPTLKEIRRLVSEDVEWSSEGF